MMKQRKKTMLRAITSLVLLLFFVTAAQPVAAQQGGTTRYIYDQNGRLRAVISPTGEAGIYDYDPAGNFTAIRRLGANDCEAISFSPTQGSFGAKVTIYGAGFKEQVSEVSFNGVPAKIVRQTSISVVAEVPDGAITGPIKVTLPCGMRTLPGQFIVSGVRVAPALITLLPGRAVQFTAVVAGITDPAVEWSVNGVKGGNDALGRITEAGLYTALNSAANSQFTIRATSVEEPSLFGEAVVKVAGASGLDLPASAVSVRYGPLPPNNNAPSYFAGSAVSVRYGKEPPNNNAPSYFASGAVSARYGPLPPNNNAPSQISSSAVSARLGAAASNVSLRIAAAQQSAPVISSVSSVAPTRGQPLTLIIKGKNLGGVTEIEFFNEDGRAEPNIVVTKIEAAAGDVMLTASVIVKEGASRGRRTLRLSSKAGKSSGDATESNIIEIVP